MADRGMSAPWLFKKMVAVGWHPFLRINLGVKARLDEQRPFVWIEQWVPAAGQQWSRTVECFAQKKSRLVCTLVLCREEG